MIFIQINRSSWQLALVLTRLTDLRLQRAPVPIWRRRVSPRQRADAVEAASTYMMSMVVTAVMPSTLLGTVKKTFCTDMTSWCNQVHLFRLSHVYSNVHENFSEGKDYFTLLKYTLVLPNMHALLCRQI